MSDSHEARTRTRVIVCGGGMVIISEMERLTFEVVRSLRSKGVAVHFILNSWGNERIHPVVDEIIGMLALVVFWMSLFLFERSWVRTMGLAVTLLVYVGLLAFIADWFLRRSARRPRPAFARTRHARSSAVP
ncbi:MAG: hypothetical protein E2P02_09920 [Acidobacteria bacterium]|nr:MAG: hypothetical protein E2P02_09920 [Acidobacteriota bacterium]